MDKGVKVLNSKPTPWFTELKWGEGYWEGHIVSALKDRFVTEKDNVLEVYMDGRKGLAFQVYENGEEYECHCGEIFVGESKSLDQIIDMARHYYAMQVLCWPKGLGQTVKSKFDKLRNYATRNSYQRIRFLTCNPKVWMAHKCGRHTFYYLTYDDPTVDWYMETLEEDAIVPWPVVPYSARRYPRKRK